MRQLMYGNGFFEKEFGVRSRIEWLPDVFGHTWALPQILKKSGIDYFATTKLCWNVYNKFPYSLFWWQGIDGTRVLSLMSEGTYNHEMEMDEIRAHWDRFNSKDLAPEHLVSYGHGDGGGGPTKEMIETGRRLENLAGMPACRFGKVEEYFTSVEKEVPVEELPVWNGELYLELHRACQTTQSRTKRLNRLSEIALRNAELYSSWALLLGGKYDSKTIYENWLVVLLNQFHDILPGSSVPIVYEVTEQELTKTVADVSEIRANAEKQIVRAIDTRGPGKPIVVFNTLSWDRAESVSIAPPELPEHPEIVDAEGQAQPLQVVQGDDAEPVLLFVANDVPSMGHTVFHLRDNPSQPKPKNPITVTENRIENDFFSIKLAKNGDLLRVYDKKQKRDVLEPNKRGNVLQLFDDRPWKHDAWDFDHNFEEKNWEFGPAESIQILESGPIRGRLRLTRRTEKSVLVQDLVIYSHTPRIDFQNHRGLVEKKNASQSGVPPQYSLAQSDLRDSIRRNRTAYQP